jgi:hypothetical protein
MYLVYDKVFIFKARLRYASGDRVIVFHFRAILNAGYCAIMALGVSEQTL